MQISHLYGRHYPQIDAGGIFFQLTCGRRLSDLYHDHDFYEIVCLLDGSFLHVIDGESIACNAGKIFFIRPGEAHLLAERSKYTNVAAFSVHPDMIDRFLQAYGISARTLRCADLTFDQLHTLNLLCVRENDRRDGHLLTALFGMVFSHLAIAEQSQEPIMPQTFRDLLFRIRNVEVFRLGVDEFLRLSNYSYSHLYRLCKQYLSMTPGEYIGDLRLRYAYDRIAYGKEDYATICESVGLCSLSHFIKAIRKKYGMTPAKIRRRHENSTFTI